MQGSERVTATPVLGKAAGAAVLGVSALALAALFPLLATPLAIAAVAVALRSRREIKASAGELGGFGFSLTGFLLGAGVLVHALLVAGLPFLYSALFLVRS